jgi:N-methylhydantoinase B
MSPSHRRARIEIVAGALEAATAEMCASLIRSAYSPNIKERADCSTAIWKKTSPGASVSTGKRSSNPREANDPYIVGVTHLNDCTAAAPIFIGAKQVNRSDNDQHIQGGHSLSLGVYH